ncbi:MAG: UPF0164 family protein [bacterium]|nr:UPF0164 family protein [bacterium]
MWKYTSFLLVAFCLIASASPMAQDGLALMKVEVGARASGMGGAFVSVAADPNSSAYNPAGAANTKQFAASLGHNTYWSDIRIETAYLASNFTNRSWIHGGIRYAAVSDLESRVGPSSQPDGLFDAHDVSFKGGLAYRLTSKLTAGVAFGWFIEKIDLYRGSAFNADLGLLYEVNPNINVGASVVNLGPDFSLSTAGRPGTEDISLPTTYRLGGSYRYDNYLGALDLVIIDDELHAHLGAEGWLQEFVALRSGYMVNYDSKNFTAGASFVRRNFTVEYAFVPYGNNLGTTHLFNLTVTL